MDFLKIHQEEQKLFSCVIHNDNINFFYHKIHKHKKSIYVLAHTQHGLYIQRRYQKFLRWGISKFFLQKNSGGVGVFLVFLR